MIYPANFPKLLTDIFRNWRVCKKPCWYCGFQRLQRCKSGMTKWPLEYEVLFYQYILSSNGHFYWLFRWYCYIKMVILNGSSINIYYFFSSNTGYIGCIIAAHRGWMKIYYYLYFNIPRQKVCYGKMMIECNMTMENDWNI